MAAGAYQLYRERHFLAFEDMWLLGVGIVAAFLSALACVRWLMRYVSSHNFTGFAWYRIAFGIAVILTAFSGLVSWNGE